MSVSESDRRDIYNQLETAIGLNAANNLMKLLPYKAADELVTRADMHAQTVRIQGEMAELRSDLRSEIAELRIDLTGDMGDLRGEMGDLRGEMGDLRGEMGELRSELRGEMGELRSEIRGEMGELRLELKGDMLQLENRLTTRFEQQFSELKTSTARLVGASMAGNTIAVVTALLM